MQILKQLKIFKTLFSFVLILSYSDFTQAVTITWYHVTSRDITKWSRDIFQKLFKFLKKNKIIFKSSH